MSNAGTVGMADLYGATLPASDTAPAPMTQQASGGIKNDATPAFSWLGFVALLVVLRVVYEYGSKD